MTNIEIQRPSEQTTNPSEWIKYQYQGNFSNDIVFDNTLLKTMIQMMRRTPRKSFLITDGEESVERVETDVTSNNLSNSFVTRHKQPAILAQEEGRVVLAINSQVIDGRIQEEQRNHFNIQTSQENRRHYRDLFIDILTGIISAGIVRWALDEDEDTKKRLFERLGFQNSKLRKFLKENRNLLVRQMPVLKK